MPDARRATQLDEIMELVSAEIDRTMAGAIDAGNADRHVMSRQRGDIEVPWEEIDAQLAAMMPA